LIVEQAAELQRLGSYLLLSYSSTGCPFLEQVWGLFGCEKPQWDGGQVWCFEQA
jgi:hypothetical protein